MYWAVGWCLVGAFALLLAMASQDRRQAMYGRSIAHELAPSDDEVPNGGMDDSQQNEDAWGPWMPSTFDFYAKPMEKPLTGWPPLPGWLIRGWTLGLSVICMLCSFEVSIFPFYHSSRNHRQIDPGICTVPLG